MCVFMSSNNTSILCSVLAFKCVLKCVHISEVLLHAGLELFYLTVFKCIFFRQQLYCDTCIQVFMVIKLHAIRGHSAGV